MTRRASHIDIRGLDRGARGLVAAFATSGVLHLVRPEIFEPIVPRALPAPRALVQLSGVAEILCAAGLLVPSTRRVAGLASAGLLLAVLPANVTMSAQAKRGLDRSPDDLARKAFFVATLARLPLQLPMIRTALRAASC
ncbi:MAG: DoxX family protein [Terracoccus sp.]